MPIEFRCTKCGKLLRVPDDAAGRKAQCPNCETILQISADVGQGTSGATPSDSASRGQSFPGSKPLPSQTERPSPSASFDQAEFGHESPGSRGPQSENPFQSPMASDTYSYHAADSQGGIVPTRIELDVVMSEAWRIFKDQMGLLVGAIIVVAAVNWAYGIFTSILKTLILDDLDAIGVLIYVVFYLLGQVLSIFLGIGNWILVLNVASGRHASLNDLFSGGPYMLRIIGASLLFSLMVLLGFLALIIPAIIIALMFGQFYFLILDRNMPIMESLSASRRITDGNKGTLFLIALIGFGLGVIGLLMCIVGVLFAAAYAAVIWVVAYRMMIGAPIGGMQPTVALSPMGDIESTTGQSPFGS